MLLEFPQPLTQGRLLRRYQRFFADVTLNDGRIVTAHCANTGSMATCGAPGDTVYLLHNANPARKLQWTWELTAIEDGFVGVNTGRPNQLVRAAVSAGLVRELKGYADVRPEVKYGKNSRIDLLLSGDGIPPCYVEIKNTTLRYENRIVFPDAVTERGLKHLDELIQEKKAGNRAIMFFLVNRPDGEAFAPADHIHHEYATELRRAVRQGVEVLAYRARHSVLGMTLGERLHVDA